MKSIIVVLAVLLVVVSAAHAGEGAVAYAGEGARNRYCAISSLGSLCRLLGKSFADERVSGLSDSEDRPPASFADIVQAAGPLGVQLDGYRITIEEILREGRPAILHLAGPSHFVVLAGCGPDTLQISDSGLRQVVPRKQIEGRFTGRALLARLSGVTGPRAVVENRDQFIALADWQPNVTGTFSLTNGGDTPLTVLVDSSTCQCTAVDPQRLDVAPGKTAFLRVTLAGPPGAQPQWVTLRTNDENRPVIDLSVRSSVPARQLVSPRILVLRARYGQVASGEVQVTGARGLQVTEVVADNGVLTASIQGRSSGETQDTVRIRVGVAASAAVGVLECALRIRTTDPSEPVVTVPVRVYIDGDLDIEPRELFLGMVKSGSPIERQITIQSKSGTSFRISAARFSSHLARSALRFTSPNRHDAHARYVLHLRIIPSKAGLLENFVEIVTDVPGQETIRVPISGLVE